MTTTNAIDSGDSRANILMVDDNPTNLQVLFKTLQSTGHRLLAAKSGEEALEIAHKAKPELILLDIMMPGIDGYETLKRLKATTETSQSAVIFLSSLNETDRKVQGFEAGAVDYISKPFQAEEVVARVNTHLTIIRLRADLARRNVELEELNRRMRSDLEAAARVQHSLLPTTLPTAPGFGFSWRYQPCVELGGDALDIFQIDDEHIGMYLLDVSGHGVPSSLLAVTVARSLVPRADRASLVVEPGWDTGRFNIVPPKEVVRRLNVLYPQDEKNPHYFTMFYGVLHIQSGALRFVSAGHPSPIFVAGEDVREFTEQNSFPIGLIPEADYEEISITLEPGSRLVVHSDGINEQRSPDGRDFGRGRVRELIRTMSNSHEEVCERVMSEVLAWAESESLDDDLSMLVVERPQEEHTAET